MSDTKRQALHEEIGTLLAECENTPTAWKSSWQTHYRAKAQQLCADATLESIPLLLRIAHQGTLQRNFGITQSGFLNCVDSMALEAARALVRLAEAQPSRDLLFVLEALRKQLTGPNAPLEFIPIHFRLARALKKINNLPIPASPPQPTRDLPIPIEKEEARQS